MRKKSLFGKLLGSTSINSCEYFTPFGKNIAVTAAVIAPYAIIKVQMRKFIREHPDKKINLIFLVGSISGLLRIY